MKTILIIGAGPAGCVAASYLSLRGYNTIILEKQTFPRFVIGESLLPLCMNNLEDAGLMAGVMNQGFQTKKGAAFHQGEKSCNFSFSEQFSDSWSYTWQMPRSKFDMELVNTAQKNGVQVEFNSTVTDVKLGHQTQITTYENQTGEVCTITSDFIVDASGYGRVLPRIFNLSKPSVQKPRASVFTHVKDDHRPVNTENNIEVYLYNANKSWIWIIPFSDNTTSIGIVTDQENLENLVQNDSKEFKNIIHNFPDLNQRFTDVEFLFEPKHISGYSIGVKQMYGDGYVLCGNSTEFIDPIFSSGVTLATSSALKAARLIDAQLNGQEVNWKTQYQDELKNDIEVFRSYIEAWYNGDLLTIFFSDYAQQDMKEQICSVLAGHVWDVKNPFVTKHSTILKTLANVIRINNKK